MSLKSKAFFPIIILTASLLSACGGGGGDSGGSSNKVNNLQMSGAVVDGYLVNSTVCLDLNGNGFCDSDSEPQTTTNEQGFYTLDVKNYQTDPNFATAKILILDGYDSDTSLGFTGKLFSEQTTGFIKSETASEINTVKTVNVSAVTTLVAKLVSAGETVESAKGKVKTALNLQIDVMADPLAALENNTANANSLISANIALNRAVDLMISSASQDAALANTDSRVLADTIFEGLAKSILAQPAPVDNQKPVSGLVGQLYQDADAKTELSSTVLENAARLAEVVVTKVETEYTDTPVTTLEAAQSTALSVSKLTVEADTVIENQINLNNEIDNTDTQKIESISVVTITDAELPIAFLESSDISLLDNEKRALNTLDWTNANTPYTLTNIKDFITSSASDITDEETKTALENVVSKIESKLANSAPVITPVSNPLNVVENTTEITTVTATDADSDTVTFYISGGEDAGKFSINTTSGLLSFVEAQDFENPEDADQNRVYLVNVTATDTKASVSKSIQVTLTDDTDESTTSEGVVNDWYLKGATVFVDYNDNGVLDTGEPSTTTDDNGNYTLPFNNITAKPLVIIGGTDIATNEPFEGIMKGTTTGGAISPITTLIREMKAAGVNDPETAVRNFLELPDGVDITQDPANSADLYAAASQVQGMVDALSGAIHKTNGASDASAKQGNAQLVIKELAAALKDGSSKKMSTDAQSLTETAVSKVVGKLTTDPTAQAEIEAQLKTATANVQTFVGDIKGQATGFANATDKKAFAKSLQESVKSDIDTNVISKVTAETPELIETKRLASAQQVLTTLESHITLTPTEYAAIKANIDATGLSSFGLQTISELPNLPASVKTKALNEYGRIIAVGEVFSLLQNAGITVSSNSKDYAQLSALDPTKLTSGYGLSEVLVLLNESGGDFTNLKADIQTKITQNQQTASLQGVKDLVSDTNNWFASLQDLQTPLEATGDRLTPILNKGTSNQMGAIMTAISQGVFVGIIADEKADGTYDIQTLIDDNANLNDPGDNDGFVSAVSGSLVKTGNTISIADAQMTVKIRNEVSAADQFNEYTVPVSFTATLPGTTATQTPVVTIENITASISALTEVPSANDPETPVLAFSATSAQGKLTYETATDIRTPSGEEPNQFELALNGAKFTVKDASGDAVLTGTAGFSGYLAKEPEVPSYLSVNYGSNLLPSAISFNGELSQGGESFAITLNTSSNNAETFKPYSEVAVNNLANLPQDPKDLLEFSQFQDTDGYQTYQVSIASGYKDRFTNVLPKQHKAIPTSDLSETAKANNLSAITESNGSWILFYESNFSNLLNRLSSDGEYLMENCLYSGYTEGQYETYNPCFSTITGYTFSFYDNDSWTGDGRAIFESLMVQGVDFSNNPSGKLDGCTSYLTTNQEGSIVCNGDIVKDAVTYQVDTAEEKVVFTLVDPNDNNRVANLAIKAYTNMFEYLAKNIEISALNYSYQDPSYEHIEVPLGYFSGTRYSLGISFNYILNSDLSVDIGDVSARAYNSGMYFENYSSEIDISSQETTSNFRQVSLDATVLVKLAGKDDVKVTVSGNRNGLETGSAEITLAYGTQQITLIATDPEGSDAAITFKGATGDSFEFRINANRNDSSDPVGTIWAGTTQYGVVNEDVATGNLTVTYTDNSVANIFTQQ